MTEALFAIAIVTLAAAGLGLGILAGRAPPRTSCGATDRLLRGRCEDCPLRGRATESEAR